MQRNKDMKLCREGDNRELSIRKDLHRFPIFLCASWNTRPACREVCFYFNIIFEVMQLFFKLLQRWQSRLGERGLPLHGGGEKARHHECPQWGLLNWSGHLRKEVIGVWGGGILAMSLAFFTSRVTSANAQKHYWGIQQKKISLFLSSKRRLMEWWMPI